MRESVSVIIEGMAEPESCELCEFAMWSNLKQAFVCKVNRKAISGSYCDVRKKKPGWCPITELTKKQEEYLGIGAGHK